jgi:diguanylate cyclase
MSRTDTPSAPTDPHPTTAFAATGAFVTNARYSRFAIRALGLALFTHATFALAFTVLRVPMMVWLNLAGMAVYAVCIGLLRRNFNGLVSCLVVLELLSYAVIATYIVGWTSGFQLYAWLIIPVAAVDTRSMLRRKIVVVVLMFHACLALEFWSYKVLPLTVLSANTIHFLHAYNLAAYLAIMAVLAFIYAQTVAEAERRLHRNATTDALTGLRNRRRLLELARDELARASRSGTPVSIIMADVDHFKRINDHFGHPIGDLVIIGIAHCLRDCVRRQDHVARWGGEEFLIVLPDIDLLGAHAAAERMRHSVQQLNVQTDTGIVTCTVSFGVSEWKHGRDETFDQCLDRADAALYAAKQSGRNRVHLSQPSVITEHRVAEVLSGGTPAGTHQAEPVEASSVTQALPSHRNAS